MRNELRLLFPTTTATSLEVGGAKEADSEDREAGVESEDEVEVLDMVGTRVVGVGADVCLYTRNGHLAFKLKSKLKGKIH
jgi:hypothetical protein